MQTNKINEKNVENHEIHFEIRKLQFYLSANEIKIYI